MAKKTIEEKIQAVFDDNENYFSSYTGTPMLMSNKAVPKIMDLINKEIIGVAEKMFNNGKRNGFWHDKSPQSVFRKQLKKIIPKEVYQSYIKNLSKPN